MGVKMRRLLAVAIIAAFLMLVILVIAATWGVLGSFIWIAMTVSITFALAWALDVMIDWWIETRENL